MIIFKLNYCKMGKKGVLLDNGKQAQSSMALYWKAGRQIKNSKAQRNQQKEQTQQDVQKNAVVGMQKWKMYKEKMITKLYSKTEKKEQKQQVSQAEVERKRQAQIQEQLLQKQLNKNKAYNIPGFKGASQLKKKMEYQTVSTGNHDTNKLILPVGHEGLTQQQIVQMLRQKKAKKQLQKNNKERLQKSQRVRQQVQIDQFLMSERDNAKKQIKQAERLRQQQQKKKKLIQEEKKAEQNKVNFKSEILQRISNGFNVFKKKQQPQVLIPEQNQQKEVDQQLYKNSKPRFIPRALWNK